MWNNTPLPLLMGEPSLLLRGTVIFTGKSRICKLLPAAGESIGQSQSAAVPTDRLTPGCRQFRSVWLPDMYKSTMVMLRAIFRSSSIECGVMTLVHLISVPLYG